MLMAFLCAKHLKVHLNNIAPDSRNFFITVARMNGQLGYGEGGFSVVSGGLFGLAKTVGLEWPEVFCRGIDMASELTDKDAAGAILYAAELATKMALDAIQILGGNGYINEYATGRLLRDAKLYEIGAGTSEIRRMLIGRELFTESR